MAFLVDAIPPYGVAGARPTDPWGWEGWLAGLAPGWHVAVAYGRGDPHSPYGLGFVAAWLFRVQAPTSP
ncbi:MAG: hypothetical protein K6U79_04850 [Firmicutes bacterium]|nr:hypothetical protein [Bacillota bacterium]